MTTTYPPPLPPGRHLDLGGRGTTFIRELPGPPGAPLVVLLHGWLATADLNWWTSYAALARSFRVVALDQRGHGRGIRGRGAFHLADCAADVAALVEALGGAPAVVVGYSMGGPVAQLVWRDHPQVVGGLVLCATSRAFPSSVRERTVFGGIAYALAASPAPLRSRALAALLGRTTRNASYREWLLSEVARHDMASLIGAGRELGRFDSSPWVGSVDVPTACLVMTEDRVVPVERQRALAAAIPGATVRAVEGDHIVCARRPEVFVPALLAACREVSARRRARGAAAARGGAA